MDRATVVITGGSSGIGKALAKEYAARGMDVIIGARRKDVLEKTQKELSFFCTRDNSVFAYELDVSNGKSIIRFIKNCIKDGKEIDILINCAGIAVCKEIENTLPEEFADTAAINYLGTALTVRHALPHIKKSARSRIVNVSSMAGVMGVYGYSAYTPSKYAVVGFSEVLRAELIPYKIGVSLVLPSDTDTPQLVNENRTKPAVTKQISGTIKPMTAEKAAQEIIRGIERGRFLIIPGFESKLVYTLNRLFPGLMYAYSKLIIKQHIKKSTQDGKNRSLY
ncbi:SDR family oxidoreductase [Treponema sp. HNW]|uniref:SDR family oxidoreductase n=1 Tax=Treponema sp. HNW TaxID=3116654 RepID=UPI003D0A0FF5